MNGRSPALCGQWWGVACLTSQGSLAPDCVSIVDAGGTAISSAASWLPQVSAFPMRSFKITFVTLPSNHT